MSPGLYGALVCVTLAAATIVYARHCRRREQVAAAMRRHPAGTNRTQITLSVDSLCRPEPVTVADSEWARWCDEAATLANPPQSDEVTDEQKARIEMRLATLQPVTNKQIREWLEGAS
jgi:hypothetical protein